MIRTEAVRHGCLDANGLRLHHLAYGGDGRPVICLSGVTGHAWAWHAVAPALTGAGSVLALDMRGHGDSQWSADGAYASEDHAADLAAVTDAVAGGDQVDLVGSSWGALIAIAFAAQAPERVRRLAIIDVEASFEQSETDLFPRPREFASHGEAVAFERTGNPHAPQALLDIVAAGGTRPGPGGTLVPKHDPYFFERWPFRRDDVWDRLPALTMPTLLVHAQDSFVRGEVMERMADAIPNATLVHLSAATHVVAVDNPAGLTEHLVPFLGEG